MNEEIAALLAIAEAAVDEHPRLKRTGDAYFRVDRDGWTVTVPAKLQGSRKSATELRHRGDIAEEAVVAFAEGLGLWVQILDQDERPARRR